jgi:hypothetical protein
MSLIFANSRLQGGGQSDAVENESVVYHLFFSLKGTSTRIFVPRVGTESIFIFP